MKKTEKYIQYAAIITEKLGEAMQEIDAEELQEGDNLTHFIHAMANTAPNHVYNKITGSENNNLEFNHIANHLVFQYSKQEN